MKGNVWGEEGKVGDGARKQPRGIKATRFTPVEGPAEHDPAESTTGTVAAPTPTSRTAGLLLILSRPEILRLLAGIQAEAYLCSETSSWAAIGRERLSDRKPASQPTAACGAQPLPRGAIRDERGERK